MNTAIQSGQLIHYAGNEAASTIENVKDGTSSNYLPCLEQHGSGDAACIELPKYEASFHVRHKCNVGRYIRHSHK
jgi:hypothetical protein